MLFRVKQYLKNLLLGWTPVARIYDIEILFVSDSDADRIGTFADSSQYVALVTIKLGWIGKISFRLHSWDVDYWEKNMVATAKRLKKAQEDYSAWVHGDGAYGRYQPLADA